MNMQEKHYKIYVDLVDEYLKIYLEEEGDLKLKTSVPHNINDPSHLEIALNEGLGKLRTRQSVPKAFYYRVYDLNRRLVDWHKGSWYGQEAK